MSRETTLAAERAEDASKRFLRYVRIDTQSDEDRHVSEHGETARSAATPRDELKPRAQDAAIDKRLRDRHLAATVDRDVPTIALSRTSTRRAR